MAANGERRSSPRHLVKLQVKFKHLGRPNESFREISHNLSTGGLFLDTTIGLEVGTPVDLEIAPGPGAHPIVLKAEVIRVEEQVVTTGSKETVRTRGMALRFSDECDRGEVRRLIDLTERMQDEGCDGTSHR